MTRPWPDAPRMVVTEAMQPEPFSNGVTVDVARTESEALAWTHIIGEAFAPDFSVDQARIEFSPPSSLLNRPDALYLLGRLDGHPVSAGALLISNGVAGLSWVGTIPEARRNGVASALVRYATHLGFAKGAHACFLFSEEGAASTYERVGYEPMESAGIHHWLKKPPV